MATEEPKTIILGGDAIHHELPAAEEATILPGQMLERDDGHLRPFSEDGGSTRRFAVEAREWGKTIDESYVPTEQTKYITAKSGMRLYLPLAAGASVTEDETLVSDGEGNLRVGGGEGDGEGYVKATEGVDNSGGSAPVRVRTEVL